ncbi:lipopolysaccharide biosynthesis [filamentous cyanobacterium CCP2]|nr:lipopolysaccharide biosynthesis [filamentous cyanobacterium CCP2]
MIPPLLKRYLIALDRHKWAGITSFLVITGLSGVVAALQPPPEDSYVAQGTLAYSAPPETFSATGAAIQQQAQSVTKEALLSGTVLEFASEQLAEQQIEISPRDLRQTARVNTNQGAETPAGATPPVLRVSVAYPDTDEARSRAVVTALMNAMVEQSRQFNVQQLDRILANLNQLLPKVTGELREVERNLEEFVRVEGTALQAAQSGNLLGAITSSQQQQREIQLALSGIDAQIRSLQSRLGLTPDEAYASSALSADPIIADLRSQIYQAEVQQEFLSNTLRPEHPSMVELQSQLDTYNQLLQDRVAEVIGGGQAAPLVAGNAIRQASSLDPARQQLAGTLVNLQTERETLQQQLVNLTRTENELRQEYSSIPNKQLEQQRLEQQVALKRTFYDQIQARLADVRLAQEETVGSLVVAQAPQSELQPATGPTSIVILLVGGFIGIFVSGGLVMLLGSLDSTFHTLEDVQAALRQQEVPVLGLLPSLPWEDEPDELPVIEQAGSPYIEPYERLRSNVRRAGGGKALKLVLLTSTAVGEGKTTTAYNLGIASARAGKRTLVIEADLRSPSYARSLGLTLDAASIMEPLRYYGNLSECIRLSSIENLYIVPSAGPQRHAAAILESSEMRRLLEDARGRFDWVILDTPALSRYNDALLLEPYSDGVALVTRPSYTEEGLLNEITQEFIESEDIKFLGAIINDTNIPIQEPEFEEDEEEPIEEFEPIRLEVGSVIAETPQGKGGHR